MHLFIKHISATSQPHTHAQSSYTPEITNKLFRFYFPSLGLVPLYARSNFLTLNSYTFYLSAIPLHQFSSIWVRWFSVIFYPFLLLSFCIRLTDLCSLSSLCWIQPCHSLFPRLLHNITYSFSFFSASQYPFMFSPHPAILFSSPNSTPLDLVISKIYPVHHQI